MTAAEALVVKIQEEMLKGREVWRVKEEFPEPKELSHEKRKRS